MNKGIDVEIIKDSINWTGKRLTTFILKYPRYIHSELMTHRVFSKNSASSRAIPVMKMINNIFDDTTNPIWTLNQSGMQGKELEDKETLTLAKIKWIQALRHAADDAKYLFNLGIHKQNINRLLEPWMHIKIILTGTDFDNWYELRNHPDAQPEIQELARKMLKAQEESTPIYLKPGEWHIPFDEKYDLSTLTEEALKRAPMGFGADDEWEDAILDLRLKISVANCARTSYNNVDGSKSTIDGDISIYKKLVESEPLHASPSEHQAQVPYPSDYMKGFMDVKNSMSFPIGEYEDIKDPLYWQNHVDRLIEEKPELLKLVSLRGKYFSNLQGWIQLRKIIEEKYERRNN